MVALKDVIVASAMENLAIAPSRIALAKLEEPSWWARWTRTSG